MSITAYRIVVKVLDFENMSLEDLIETIERDRNLSITVDTAQKVEIANWDDDHPLNKSETHQQTFLDLFQEAPIIYRDE